jgi:hypothetical protein
MRDREKLEALLAKRFPGSKDDQIAAAANAIMGLEDDWEEVPTRHSSPPIRDTAVEFRILRRRTG